MWELGEARLLSQRCTVGQALGSAAVRAGVAGQGAAARARVALQVRAAWRAWARSGPCRALPALMLSGRAESRTALLRVFSDTCLGTWIAEAANNTRCDHRMHEGCGNGMHSPRGIMGHTREQQVCRHAVCKKA